MLQLTQHPAAVKCPTQKSSASQKNPQMTQKEADCRNNLLPSCENLHHLRTKSPGPGGLLQPLSPSFLNRFFTSLR